MCVGGEFIWPYKDLNQGSATTLIAVLDPAIGSNVAAKDFECTDSDKRCRKIWRLPA